MSEHGTLLSQFFQEALDLLAEAEEGILELEQYGKNDERVRSLFRTFHTLKGNSNMVGEGEISTVTHALESEYDKVRSGKRELDSALLQLSFEVIDVLTAIAQEGASTDYLDNLRELSERLQAGGLVEEAGKVSPSRAREAGADQPGATEDHRALSGTAMPSPEEARRTSFSLWIGMLRHFYRVRDIYDSIRKGEGELFEQLMDLGMESIELRSESEKLPEAVSRPAAYLEKCAATFAREEIPYNEISYELLDMLLKDINRGIWQELFLSGALVYKKIVTMEELGQLEKQLRDDRKLWIIDLAFSSSNIRRSNDFFTKMAELNKKIEVPFIFISSHSGYYRKATALLDLTLGGFPRVAKDIEEGVKLYLAREE